MVTVDSHTRTTIARRANTPKIRIADRAAGTTSPDRRRSFSGYATSRAMGTIKNAAVNTASPSDVANVRLSALISFSSKCSVAYRDAYVPMGMPTKVVQAAIEAASVYTP